MQQIQEKLRYKRTLVSESIDIAINSSTSTILDCGGMQPRALLFPTYWLACDITLHFSLTPTGQMYQMSKTSGTVLEIPTMPLQCLPLIFPDSDCAPYFQIRTSIPQEFSKQKIIVILQPLYQGIHG